MTNLGFLKDAQEKRKQATGDILVLYGMLMVFSFIFRLWPVMLLALAGLFLVLLCMLFQTLRMIAGDDGKEAVLQVPEKAKLSARELELAVIRDMEEQITESVLSRWQDAAWHWECPDAERRIREGRDLTILLNHAGGCRKARVVYHGMKVIGLDCSGTGGILDEPAADSVEDEPEVANYQLVAFQWCEAHLEEILDRCDAAGQSGQSEMLVPLEELPTPESWEDIRRELVRQSGLQAGIMTDGILMIL